MVGLGLSLAWRFLRDFGGGWVGRGGWVSCVVQWGIWCFDSGGVFTEDENEKTWTQGCVKLEVGLVAIKNERLQ